MRSSGRNNKLWNGCVAAIAIVLVHLSQQVWVTAHERGNATEVVLRLAPVMTPKIIVPEPDPALYGHLLEDRALARVRLVSLGDEP